MTVFRTNLGKFKARTLSFLRRRRMKRKNKKMKVQRTRLMTSNKIYRKKFASFTST